MEMDNKIVRNNIFLKIIFVNLQKNYKTDMAFLPRNSNRKKKYQYRFYILIQMEAFVLN